MKTITSTAFQKAYPRLAEPHQVTALGRLIGTWYPAGTNRSVTVADIPTTRAEPVRLEFNPVPKPGKK